MSSRQQPSSLLISAAMLLRPLIGAAVVAALCCRMAQAAELDGLQLPDLLQINGKTLHLNGFGLRTYSILGIHIYIAALYLEHLSTNAEEIVASPEAKLLNIRFQHDVSAEDARKAWLEGLEKNCTAPCHLDPDDLARFLTAVPVMHAGDNYSLLFTQNGAIVTVNGHQAGTISQRLFAEAILATFLGPAPASPQLEHELLQGHG